MRRPPSFPRPATLGVVLAAVLVASAATGMRSPDHWSDVFAAGSAEEASFDGGLDLRRGVRARPAASAPSRSAAPFAAAFDGVELDGGSPLERLPTESNERWVARNAAEAVLLLDAERAGTYIDELLVESDSALTRWPARGRRPLTYWVQWASDVDSWGVRHPQLVRDAFAEWNGAELPVRFAAATDSSRADIVVTWTSRFQEPISGKTRWTHDRTGWIRSASITIALHRSGGDPLDDDAVRAIALHEIGHALGLDHTRDAGNVMAPRVRVRALSEADRATAQLLYRLPPGSLRQGR